MSGKAGLLCQMSALLTMTKCATMQLTICKTLDLCCGQSFVFLTTKTGQSATLLCCGMCLLSPVCLLSHSEPALRADSICRHINGCLHRLLWSSLLEMQSSTAQSPYAASSAAFSGPGYQPAGLVQFQLEAADHHFYIPIQQ